MKRCKKNLNSINGIKGIGIEKIFLYQLCNKNEIVYIGITSDVKQTRVRHLNTIYNYDVEMLIVGEFYDRHLAEFFEIVLIKECLTNGNKLINKIIDFV